MPQPGAFTDADRTLLGRRTGLLAKRAAADSRSRPSTSALEAIWQVVGEANRYVDEQAPWALHKTDPARMATVLYVLAETMRQLAILVQPFMPHSMAKMLDQLAVPAARAPSRRWREAR